MVCSLHCVPTHQGSPAAIASAGQISRVYKHVVISTTGKLPVRATAHEAIRRQCRTSKSNGLRVRASTKGFGQKPQAPQQKKNKHDNSAFSGDVSEQQSPPPQRPSQPQQIPRNDEDQEEVPEIVNDRMLKRIIAFCGIPVFTGFLLFPFFYYLKVTQHVDLPMSVVYIVQLLTFGGGFFGITYGILSASWDPRREGSVLGITEFKANLPLILDRVKSRGGKGRV